MQLYCAQEPQPVQDEPVARSRALQLHHGAYGHDLVDEEEGQAMTKRKALACRAKQAGASQMCTQSRGKQAEGSSGGIPIIRAVICLSSRV